MKICNALVLHRPHFISTFITIFICRCMEQNHIRDRQHKNPSHCKSKYTQTFVLSFSLWVSWSNVAEVLDTHKCLARATSDESESFLDHLFIREQITQLLRCFKSSTRYSAVFFVKSFLFSQTNEISLLTRLPRSGWTPRGVGFYPGHLSVIHSEPMSGQFRVDPKVSVRVVVFLHVPCT